MHSISNDILSINVVNKGAELQSIYHEQHKLEYMWSGDSTYWAKKSPVLFPVVGGLKNNTYHYERKSYQLSRHGFARDKNFEMVEQTATSITFQLRSNEETMRSYPFDFLFLIKYTLVDNKLLVTFRVENSGVKELLFSVGAHPAFAVPLIQETEYKDYYLQFNQRENAERWPLSAEGLIETDPFSFLQNEDKLRLKKELFYKDAIVLKNLRSNSISILSNKTSHGVKVEFNNFSYMGIWAAKDAEFVCIEPWCGIADHVNASGNLEDKEGIQTLSPQEEFVRNYTIEVF